MFGDWFGRGAWQSVVAGVMAVYCGVAHAQTISLGATIGSNAASATFDGLTVSLNSCSYSVNTGTASSSPGCGSLTNAEISLGLSASGGLDISVINSTGGALVTATCPSGSAACASGANGYYNDLAFGLSIAPAKTPSRTTVSSVSATVSGTDPGSGYSSAHISAGLVVTPTSQTSKSLTVYADGSSTTTPSNYPATGSLSFNAASTLSINTDLRLNLANVPAGNTLSLTRVSQILTPAPEPASVGLLMTALGGLAAIRRKRARPSGAENRQGCRSTAHTSE